MFMALGFVLIIVGASGIIGLITLAAILIGAISMGAESHTERKERKKALKQVIWNEDARNGDYSDGPIGSNYAIGVEEHGSGGNAE